MSGQWEWKTGSWRVRYSVEESAEIPGKRSQNPEAFYIINHLTLFWTCCLILKSPQAIYKKNDMDGSGTISTPELRMALKEAGESSQTQILAHIQAIIVFLGCILIFTACVLIPLLGFCLNNAIFQLLVARYAETDMTLDFDNFVACLMRLEMMFRKSLECSFIKYLAVNTFNQI